MSASWLNLPASEKLHEVYKGDWHDSIVSKATRVLASPIPFLSEWEDEHGLLGQFSEAQIAEDSSQELLDSNKSWPSDIPSDIAEVLFGQRSS